ncbi:MULTISPECIES: hypothetical protein [Rhodonellum]|uniref:hypothetical protein n=1 Tax=Rhodonellum TaxID=336827 RepID=UPI001113C4DC|nr:MULTISPECIES: hypothetical protein [Rhodonellum]
MEGKEKLTNQEEEAYQGIISLTETYNQNISIGKWSGMMSMNPRNLLVFSMPVFHVEEKTTPKVKSKSKLPEAIAIQAKNYSNLKNSANHEWKTVEALGYSDTAIT